MMTYSPEDGWYAMSPILSHLHKDDFLPVAQYLERGEYNPNILDEGTDWVRLEKDISGHDAGEEVVRCAIIYNMAHTLELPGLQDLAFRKLKSLAKNVPHSPLAILCVVEHAFQEARADLREYLVGYLAEHFWTLVTAEPAKSAQVMEADGELASGVFGLLAQQVGDKDGAGAGAGRQMGEENFWPEIKAEAESVETVKDHHPEGVLATTGIAEENALMETAMQNATTEEDTNTTTAVEGDSTRKEPYCSIENLTEEGFAQDPDETMIKTALCKSGREATMEVDEGSTMIKHAAGGGKFGGVEC